MIKHYLESSIKNIEKLIALTLDDIEDIKKANNDAIYKRTRIKEDIIEAFEDQKVSLDKEFIKLIEQNNNKELSELLSSDEQKNLEILKTKLQELHKANKEYARMVVAVNEFYTSLFDKIFPIEVESYKKTNPKSLTLLKVSV